MLSTKIIGISITILFIEILLQALAIFLDLAVNSATLKPFYDISSKRFSYFYFFFF